MFNQHKNHFSFSLWLLCSKYKTNGLVWLNNQLKQKKNKTKKTTIIDNNAGARSEGFTRQMWYLGQGFETAAIYSIINYMAKWHFLSNSKCLRNCHVMVVTLVMPTAAVFCVFLNRGWMVSCLSVQRNWRGFLILLIQTPMDTLPLKSSP